MGFDMTKYSKDLLAGFAAIQRDVINNGTHAIFISAKMRAGFPPETKIEKFDSTADGARQVVEYAGNRYEIIVNLLPSKILAPRGDGERHLTLNNVPNK